MPWGSPPQVNLHSEISVCIVIIIFNIIIGLEGVYRNPASEVQRFFNTYHKEHYKIINLCAEKAYDLGNMFYKMESYGFFDHNPCPFDLMHEYCLMLDAWFAEHPDNVAGIHCKAGKGRTGKDEN